MRVLLVEDSATVVALLREICSRQPDVDFLEPARDGRAGVERALAERPDVILMDLLLPELDGISAIQLILAEAAIPIVVFSAHLDASRTFAALNAGAVDVLPKPKGLSKESLSRFERQLMRTLAVMKEARVIRRGTSSKHRLGKGRQYAVAVIGASTGGPQALFKLFSELRAPFPAPILIVQHTYAGFEEGLARWLESTGHATGVASDGEPLTPGRVYLSPSEGHLVVRERGIANVLPHAAEDLNPSVDQLFESAAVTYGARAVGVLLTGMGRDGAAGLLALRNSGALTVTQLGTTCVVDGMPAAARALGASSLELDVSAIARLLARVLGKGKA